jgi:hypothetical protein
MMKRAIAAGLVLALLLSCGGALADSKAAARRQARVATKLFDEGKYREAAAAFEKAYAIRPHYLIQCNIARCHERLNEPSTAVGHYRRCLDEGGADSPQSGEIREALAAVEHKVGAGTPPPPPVAEPVVDWSRRPFWVVLGMGGGIRVKDLVSQFKLRAAFGYHFQGGLTGPTLGIDLSVGLSDAVTSVEVGPIFAWDFALLVRPQIGLYLAPLIGLGFAHLAPSCPAGAFCPRWNGLDLQIAGELKLVINGRGLVAVRPFGLDLLFTTTSGGGWLTSVHYNLLVSGGVIF